MTGEDNIVERLRYLEGQYWARGSNLEKYRGRLKQLECRVARQRLSNRVLQEKYDVLLRDMKRTQHKLASVCEALLDYQTREAIQ